MKKSFWGAVLIVLCLFSVTLMGDIWADGTTANMHPGSDITHSEDDPYTQLYQCRLDSGYARLEATEGWNGSAAGDSAQFIGEWNTNWTRLPFGVIGFTYMLRLTAVDTTHGIDDNDSIWISVETSSNPNSWSPNINTIHEFAFALDTVTKYEHFPPDSAAVQVQFGFVRTEIVYHAWQDSAMGFFDSLTHTPMYLEETIIPIK